MSLVARGLAKGILVTAGLGLTLTIVTPVIPPQGGGGPLTGLQKYDPAAVQYIKAEISLSAVQHEYLLGEIAASGSAQVRLMPMTAIYSAEELTAAGAAQTQLVYVEHATQTGQILAEGRHDVSDEDIIALLLSDILQ